MSKFDNLESGRNIFRVDQTHPAFSTVDAPNSCVARADSTDPYCIDVSWNFFHPAQIKVRNRYREKDVTANDRNANPRHERLAMKIVT